MVKHYFLFADNLLASLRPLLEDGEEAGKRPSLAYAHENFRDGFSNVDDIVIVPLPQGSSSENDIQQLNQILTGITERYLEPGDRLGGIDNLSNAIADERNKKNLSSEHFPVLSTSERLSEAFDESPGKTHGNDNIVKIASNLNVEKPTADCRRCNEDCFGNDTSHSDREVLQNTGINETPLVHRERNMLAVTNRTGVNDLNDSGQYTPGNSVVGDWQDNEGPILDRITSTAISFCNRRKIAGFEHLLQSDGSFGDIKVSYI